MGGGGSSLFAHPAHQLTPHGTRFKRRHYHNDPQIEENALRGAHPELYDEYVSRKPRAQKFIPIFY